MIYDRKLTEVSGGLTHLHRYAMTDLQLHSKSDIAQQLAIRDDIIANLLLLMQKQPLLDIDIANDAHFVNAAHHVNVTGDYARLNGFLK